MKTYKFIYKEGEFWSLAHDDEDAAWRAHNHGVNCGWTLIDVIPYKEVPDVEKTLLPK